MTRREMTSCSALVSVRWCSVGCVRQEGRERRGCKETSEGERPGGLGEMRDKGTDAKGERSGWVEADERVEECRGKERQVRST